MLHIYLIDSQRHKLSASVPFHRTLYSAWFYVELFNVIYCAHNKIIFTPLGWFPISDQRKPRATSNFTFNIYIQILTRKVRICQGFVLVAVVRSPLFSNCCGFPCMLHCSSCCQLTGIQKINRTATFAGVHSFLLGWRIN